MDSRSSRRSASSWGERALPYGEKRLLCCFGGVLRVPAHPQRQRKDPLLIQADQRFKGIQIPAPGGGDQLLFL